MFVAVPIPDMRCRVHEVYGPFVTREEAKACAMRLSTDPDECEVVPVVSDPFVPEAPLTIYECPVHGQRRHPGVCAVPANAEDGTYCQLVVAEVPVVRLSEVEA